MFNDWEQKTIEIPTYKDDWTNNLETLFEGIFLPENNPLVFVEPNTFKNFPNCEILHNHILSLPTHSNIKENDIVKICKLINEFEK